MTFYEKLAVKKDIERRRGADPCLSSILPELLAMQEKEQAQVQAKEERQETDKRITAVEEWVISQARTQNDLYRLAMDLMRRVEYLENVAMVVQKTSSGAKLFAPLNEHVI